jgi:hypothetical protein
MKKDTMIGIILKAQADAQAKNVLNIWTIFDRPSDFPDSYVARVFEYDKPTATIIKGTLPRLRKSFRLCGLTCLTRCKDDDPVIVETWL